MISFKLLKSDIKAVKTYFTAIDKVSRKGILKMAQELRKEIKRTTPDGAVSGKRAGALHSAYSEPGKSPGQMKKSWTRVRKFGPDGFAFSSDRDYAETLEFGRYKKPSAPNPFFTEAYRSGVYSYQALGGMVTPYLRNERQIKGKSAHSYLTETAFKVMDKELDKLAERVESKVQKVSIAQGA